MKATLEDLKEETVLLVEDDKEKARQYREWLDDRYQIYVAGSDEEALGVLERDEDGGKGATEESSNLHPRLDSKVNVVLVDENATRLPHHSPLKSIRESNPEKRMAILMNEEPDFDVIQMGFDAGLVKPVSKKELVETVERLIFQSIYHDLIEGFFRISAKKGMLEATQDEEVLKADPEYIELEARVEEVKRRIDRIVEDFEDDDFVATFSDLPYD